MNLRKVFLLVIMTFTLMLSACSTNTSNNTNNSTDIQQMTFEQIKDKAKGQTVNFYGYAGDTLRNDFIDNTFIPYVEKEYGVKVNRVGMDIDAINNILLNEKQAGTEGTIDLVWINGENFYANKKAGLLFGPFTDKLPNFDKYVDKESTDVKYDFANAIEGYESPYGKAQLVFIYDSEKVPNSPKNLDELKEWIKNNPGKFTYPQMPDFTSSAFVRNVISNLVGYEQFMDTSKDWTYEELLEKVKPAIDYLNEIKPYLWNEGKTYPSDLATLNNMYKDGEVYMTMSYNPSSASVQVEKGVYPNTTKTFVFDEGTIGNTHFLAIPANAKNKEAAMVVANAMLSFDMQIYKYNPKVLGDMPVFDVAKLNDEEKAKLNSLEKGEATLSPEELLSKRIPEMPAKLVPIFEKIWEKEILSK